VVNDEGFVTSMLRGVVIFFSGNMEELFYMNKGHCDEVSFPQRKCRIHLVGEHAYLTQRIGPH